MMKNYPRRSREMRFHELLWRVGLVLCVFALVLTLYALYRNIQTTDSTELAVQIFEDAVELEPRFAHASGLALCQAHESLHSLQGMEKSCGVVTHDGVVVLCDADQQVVYSDSGVPVDIWQQPKIDELWAICGLDLPEEWCGSMIAVVPDPHGTQNHFVAVSWLSHYDQDIETNLFLSRLYWWDGCGYTEIIVEHPAVGAIADSI